MSERDVMLLLAMAFLAAAMYLSHRVDRDRD